MQRRRDVVNMITLENSPNPPSVKMRLCKHRKSALMHANLKHHNSVYKLYILSSKHIYRPMRVLVVAHLKVTSSTTLKNNQSINFYSKHSPPHLPTSPSRSHQFCFVQQSVKNLQITHSPAVDCKTKTSSFIPAGYKTDVINSTLKMFHCSKLIRLDVHCMVHINIFYVLFRLLRFPKVVLKTSKLFKLTWKVT